MIGCVCVCAFVCVLVCWVYRLAVGVVCGWLVVYLIGCECGLV